MIRKFNYTGRRKIPKRLVTVELDRSTNGLRSFAAKLSLANLKLPAAATVFVEAYYKTSCMRFDFGTVGKVVPPKDRVLYQLPTSDVVHFRVRVVDRTTNQGLVLALADSITACVGDRRSLLPVTFMPMENRVWELELGGARPVLEVNCSLGDDIREVVKSDGQFFGTVLPAALRELLLHIALERDDVDPTTPDEWGADWLRFAMSLPNVPEWPTGADDSVIERRKAWVDTAVESFCDKHRAALRFRQSRRGEVVS